MWSLFKFFRKRDHSDAAEPGTSQDRSSKSRKVETVDDEQPSTSGLGTQVERTEPVRGECMICGGDGYILYPSTDEVLQVPDEGYVAPACPNVEHLSCVECMTGHINQRIADKMSVVPCPATDCNYTLSSADLARFSGSDSSAHALTANQGRELAGGLISCPGQYQGKACPARYDIGTEMVDQAFPYKCETCETRFCLGCLKTPPHPAGMSCKAMRERNIFELTDIGHPVATKIESSKDSPGIGVLCRCGVFIQRISGCIHMTHVAGMAGTRAGTRTSNRALDRDVKACNAQFCYVCRSPWSDTEGICIHLFCRRKPVSCISCKARAVRFQVGTEHYVCQGTPAHEFCRSCDDVWDRDHENLLDCPVAPQDRASTSMASLR